MLLALVAQLRRRAVEALNSLSRLFGIDSLPRLTLTRSMADQHNAGVTDVRSQPVLCFGDSITEGYHNIWPHPDFAPARGDFPSDGAPWHAHEHNRLLLKPYAIYLGHLLAADVGDEDGGYSSSLRYARARGFSGWTAEELLPELRRSLREGPWRCAVILAGVNDVLRDGIVDVPTLMSRIEALFRACDEAGVRVVALTPLECDMANHGWVAPEHVAPRTEALAQLAQAVKESCKRARRVCVDVRVSLPLSKENFDDAVHPTPAASAKIAQAVHSAMRAYCM